jgi:predicted RNase H-like nuclease (RuvC/YqgF family)
MPLPLALLGVISPLKRFLTPRNIMIAVGVAALGYFIWSYNSMRTEIGELKADLKVQSEQVEKANANVIAVTESAAEAAERYQAQLEEAAIRCRAKLNKVQEVCTRTDRVDTLNRTLTRKPTVEKPQEVLDLEKSLNDRLNQRGFQ